MLEKADVQGIESIVATPHFRHDRMESYPVKVINSFQRVEELIKSNGFNIKLILGGEIMYSSKALEMLDNHKFPTINGTRYILVEFPVYIQFKELKMAIHDLIGSGYIPIIAHVERYQFVSDIKEIYVLEKLGAYCQLNTGIVLGHYGYMKRRFAYKLIKNKLVHFIASDGHNDRRRKIDLGQAYKVIERKFGKETAVRIFTSNQEKVLKGENLGV